MILVLSQFHVRRARHGKADISFASWPRTKRMRWIKWLSLYIPVIFSTIFPKTIMCYIYICSGFLIVSLSESYCNMHKRSRHVKAEVTPCHQVEMWINRHLIWGCSIEVGTLNLGSVGRKIWRWDNFDMVLEYHPLNLAVCEGFICIYWDLGCFKR